jgi:hypothetical protein
MESLSFKHAPIRVGSDLNNLSFLVATNGNCSTTNALTEVKGIGYYNSYPLQSPNGYITNNVSFQYLIQNNDPIRSILELHKSGQFQNATPYYVDIGGLTFKECYLESFSLNINPSTVASAQVNFISYSPASGQFGKYQLPANTNIDADFLHGTETNISIEKDKLTNLSSYSNNVNDVIYNSNSIYVYKGGSANTLNTIFNSGEFQAGDSLLTSDAIYIQTGISFGIFFVYNDGLGFDPITWQSLGDPNPANNTIIPSGAIIIVKSLTNKSYTIGNGAIIELQNELPSEYFGLNYNIRLQHQPINTIGSSYPKTIKFHGVVEDLELTENLYKRILYTGDAKSITINSSAVCCPDIDYSISIDNAQSISASASTQNNGVVTTLRKFTKYY